MGPEEEDDDHGPGGGQGTARGPHLLKLICDGLGLLVPLEPHHVQIWSVLTVHVIEAKTE